MACCCRGGPWPPLPPYERPPPGSTGPARYPSRNCIWPRAEALARTITDPNSRAGSLARLGTAAAQAGDEGRAGRLAAEAEALARTITDLEDRDWALADVAIATTRAGGLDRAEALARTLTDPYSAQRALAELARAVAQAGDPDRARDLLALALSTDSPEIVWWMEALTECFPDVVRDVGDMFLTALVPDGSAEQLAGDD